jgi:hypothetical protein
MTGLGGKARTVPNPNAGSSAKAEEDATAAPTGAAADSPLNDVRLTVCYCAKHCYLQAVFCV